jgi:hypothetical protein
MPLITDEHHSKWDIIDDHKLLAFHNNFQLKDYTVLMCSNYLRSKNTLFATFPELDMCMYSCLLNEIHKPDETDELFKLRVQEAIMTYIAPQAQSNNVFISSHNRFMQVAYRVLTGEERDTPFEYLESFTFDT